MRSTVDLKRVAAAGAGFVLDAGKFSPLDLKAIVSSAKGTVTIKNVKDLSTMDMKAIAAAGAGRVIFDLCE